MNTPTSLELVNSLYFEDKYHHPRTSGLNSDYFFCSAGGKLKVFDRKSWEEVTTLNMPLFSKIYGVQCDGPYVLVLSTRESHYQMNNRPVDKYWVHLRVWEAKDPWKVVLNKKIKGLTYPFHVDEQYIYIKEFMGFIRILSQEKQETIGYLPKSTDLCESIDTDKNYVYGLFRDILSNFCMLQIWKKGTWELVQSFRLDKFSNTGFAQDSESVYFSAGQQIMIIQKHSWKILKRLEYKSELYESIALSSPYLFATTEKKELICWNLQTMKVLPFVIEIQHTTGILYADEGYVIGVGQYSDLVSVFKIKF